MCGVICLISYGQPIDVQQSIKCLEKLEPRGPDNTKHLIIKPNENVEIFIGFTRLAIMDLSDNGMQPFIDDDGNVLVCNGEIYNYSNLIIEQELQVSGTNDCEVFLPLFRKLGIDNLLSRYIDAEFASIIYSNPEKTVFAARDRYGVRPLYFGYNGASDNIRLVGFASELKALHPIMTYVEQVKPGYIYQVRLEDPVADIDQDIQVGRMISRRPYFEYQSIIKSINKSCDDDSDIVSIRKNIQRLLTEAVRKRLSSDRKIGFLLSGGLDSSLIVSIATRILGADNIECFSIGLENSPDVIAAKAVCEYLGIKKHHIIPFSVEIGLANLERTVEMIETYDLTTIRASVPQELIARYIRNHTDIRVLLSGEGSDEIHGSYRYFRDAPNPEEHRMESIRLLENIHFFDNQRTDRTMAGNGLEVRVPFLDHAYVSYVLSIDPKLWFYQQGEQMEKQLLRDSFKGYLPDSILYRSKEAFSDAVSDPQTNWADAIKNTARSAMNNNTISNTKTSIINPPLTEDAVYLRGIFNKFYPGRDAIIPYYWLPRFQEESVLDPSALVLKCYSK